MPKNTNLSKMYCVICGNEGIPINRKRGQNREPGHLKKLYCPYCKMQENMVEIRGYGQYTKEDFLIEYKYGNFNEEGLRIDPSWKHFISEIKQKIAKGELYER